jgi:tRNA nucleotidyltransferase/poly(A) polymerase
LINLNILNFVINIKVKYKNFSQTLNKILKSKNHHFNINGKYLIENGMRPGALMGKVLKEIEEEWIRNNFNINKEKIKEIIKFHTN